MSHADAPDLRAATMERAAVDEFLRDRGFGVLALAADGAAYPLPISFGYDGERLYFVFLRTAGGSRKRRFARETGTAAFLVYDVESAHRWRSAVAYGPLRELPEDEWNDAVEAVEDNAWHPDLFASATPTQGVEWWALAVEEVTGRRSAGTG